MKFKITLAEILRKSTALLLGSAILCSSYVQLIACSGGWEDEGSYSLIPQEIASWDPYAPYFESGHSIFGRTDDPDILVPSNMEAWESFFGTAQRNDISTLIFKSEEKELLSLIQSIKNKESLPEAWKSNTLAQLLYKKPKAAVLDYLSFAKRCEKHATRANDDWWGESSPIDSNDIQALLVEGTKLAKKTRDKELKARYHYQILRLNFYLGAFQEVNTYYSETLGKTEWNNKLKYQALNYDFGASWHLAQERDSISPQKKAALILKLSKTFQYCEDCPLLHFEDLHYFNAEDFFDASLTLKQPQDLIDLWMLASLRSIPPHVALDKIVAIDPNAPEVRYLMDHILSQSQGARFKHNELTTTDYFATEEWNQVRFVMKKASLNKKATDRAQFAFMLAYFDYISGKFHKSREELENSMLLPGAENPLLIQQQRVLRSLLDLETWNSKNIAQGHLLVGQLNEVLAINHGDLTTYAFRRLEELAIKNGEMRKESLLFASMYRPIESDLSYPDMLLLESSLLSKEKNVIERWVWKHHPINLEQIKEWQGDVLLIMHRFDEAAEMYRASGTSKSLITDPFHTRLRDCHDCDHEQVPGNLTRLTFCEKMSTLNTQAEKGDGKAAFDYANALYNITWFGNSRDAINHTLMPNAMEESFYKMEAPLAAYERAFKLAPSKENKAICLFMMAKCEQNQFYTDGTFVSYTSFYGEDEPCDPVKNQEFRKSFAKLKNGYANTEFYKMALKECSYFQHYVKVH